MDRKDQGRKEPTLADLEAFEKLLRESLQGDTPTKPAAAEQASAPQHPQSPPPDNALPPDGPVSADQAAMAELARLIDRPVDFTTPTPPVRQAAPQPLPAATPALDHVEGHIDATLTPDWRQDPPVAVSYAATEPTPSAGQTSAPLDPLAAFEQELRRFDAVRLAEQRAAPPDMRTDYPAQEPIPQAAGYDQPQFSASEYRAPHYAEPNGHSYVQGHAYPQDQALWDDQRPAAPAETEAEASLHAAEERLAAQAAAAAASARASSGGGRSRAIFLALGGIAIAGGAVLAGSMLFGSGSDPKSGGGSVPLIAAKPEPAKERPANPGGLEIPNQNKQVLSPRNANDSQPAQVVNNTEQPLDLNQVTRRDGVRVVAPSPYQTGANPAGEASSAALEPRRVTSVRIPAAGEGPGSVTTSIPPTPGGVPPAAASAAAGIPPVRAAAPPVVSSPTPVNAPFPPIAPPGRNEIPATPPAAPLASTATPPKVEARPTTSQAPGPPGETARPATPPARTANAPTAAPSTNTANRPTNAPLVISPINRPSSPPTAARSASATTEDPDTPPPAQATSGAYAVQLASRPTEDDARTASAQLRGRFSAALGGKAPSVVSGTANGQTVYRVRVVGYSQAAAVQACNKVKAAGGNCFVTRQ